MKPTQVKPNNTQKHGLDAAMIASELYCLEYKIKRVKTIQFPLHTPSWLSNIDSLEFEDHNENPESEIRTIFLLTKALSLEFHSLPGFNHQETLEDLF